MENYVGMSELVEIIFGKKCTISEQKVAHTSILTSFFTEDLLKKMKEVWFRKTIFIHFGYEEFFAGHIQKVLSSHEEYLRYLMSICLRECEENRNIFDSFVGVCTCVQYVSDHTFAKTGVDFHDLNPDIFMVFYRKVLKTAFLKQKGFYRFLEYIRTHKYLESKNLHQEIHKESSRYRFQKLPNDTKSSKKVNARSLAQEVLSNTSVELPALPSEHDLIKTMVAKKKKEMADKAEATRRFEAALTNKTSRKPEMSLEAEMSRIKAALVEILRGNSGLNPDAETNYFDKQQEDIARHENIIQAVTRHNSKNANHENANNQISKEADVILEHLKSTIKSLTEVLDECDKN